MIELKQKIKEIEYNYINLLESIDKETTDSSVFSSLDSIRLFWYKNRKIVNLFLSSLKYKNAFFYSGATHLDVNDKEFYGFLACGKIHIMDDQLYKFAETILMGKNIPGIEQIKHQFQITLHDNISVLKSLKNIIYLLPVRLFMFSNKPFEIAEKCFLSFFDNKFSSIDDYLKACKTADDIKNYFRDDLKKGILFYKNDSFDLSFAERINKIPKELYGDLDINYIFLFCLIGYITQTLEILECMHKFNIIPIIRNEETLSFIFLLEPNLSNTNEYINKIVLSNTIFKLFNKHLVMFKDKSPQEINDIFNKKDLFTKFYSYFDLSEKSICDIPFDNRIHIIEEELLKLG